MTNTFETTGGWGGREENLTKEMENNQMEVIDLKKKITKIKVFLDGLNNRIERMAEERIRESEQQRENSLSLWDNNCIMSVSEEEK